MRPISEAENTTFRTPFVDVPTWAASYVGYAYNYKITNGMGPKEFGSDYQLSDFMFLTLVLRALGYSDSGETPNDEEPAKKDHSQCKASFFDKLINVIINFFARLFGGKEKCVCGEFY